MTLSRVWATGGVLEPVETGIYNVVSIYYPRLTPGADFCWWRSRPEVVGLANFKSEEGG